MNRKETKKDRECATCKFVFDCRGKLLEVERCLYYKRRREDGRNTVT